MDSKKDQAIVAILTIMLISLYAVIPALGGTGEGGVKVVNKQTGKEVPGAIEKASDKSNSDNDDGGSSGGSSNNDDNSDDSTVDGLNPLNIGKKMVGEGFIYFLELLADAGFSVGMSSDGDTQNIKENYGNAVALVYTMASIEFNPYDNQFIIDSQMRCGILGLFIIILYIFLGAININIYAMTSAKNSERAYILSNRYHIPINEYGMTLIETCMLFLGGYAILRITLWVELLFTKLIMIQVLDRILPTGGNIVMYLMMSICYLLISLAIAYRILVIGLFHAAYIIFVGLYSFGITREVALSAFWYYMKLLFLRPILVGVTAIGIGIISLIQIPQAENHQWINGIVTLLIHPCLYLSLTIILVIVCLCMILGIRNVISASKTTVRKYKYGVPF